MDLKKVFKIRKKDAESDEVIITIGNHLATEQVFKSEEEAQKVIDGTDWNLVAAMIYACKKADQWEEKQKETLKKEARMENQKLRTTERNTSRSVLHRNSISTKI
jgi:hypothetical protein